MKKIFAMLVFMAMFMLSGCFGYSSRESEVTGQPKKVINQTPIICPERSDLDLSLGVVRGGVGSMSTSDLYLTIGDKAEADSLKKAVDSGYLVKVVYNTNRVTICQYEHEVSKVTILRN